MRLNWLLVFFPIGVGLDWCGANPLLVFLTSALAIVPLAGLMGDATEALARFLGPTVGGLLNATLGNAPEIIKEKAERPDEVHEEPVEGWSRNKALVILAAVTTALAIMSEVLTGSIEPASESLHLGPRFTGVFLLALVGNAAELCSAIRFARKDQMDLCIGITVGASVQVGLVVAPVLVFMGMLMGQDMDLIFSPLELIAIVMAIYVTRNLIYDGESTWLEGLILIGVYFLFGIGFLNHPGTDPPNPLFAPGRRGPTVIGGDRVAFQEP